MSPKPKTKAPQPSSAEQFARSRVMKGSAELAAAFDIHDAPPRELVRVESLPDPPDVVVPGAPAPERDTPMDLDETIVNIFREEADELSVRLKRYGVNFSPQMQQEFCDHGMALLSGLVSGGASVRRR